MNYYYTNKQLMFITYSLRNKAINIKIRRTQPRLHLCYLNFKHFTNSYWRWMFWDITFQNLWLKFNEYSDIDKYGEKKVYFPRNISNNFFKLLECYVCNHLGYFLRYLKDQKSFRRSFTPPSEFFIGNEICCNFKDFSTE